MARPVYLFLLFPLAAAPASAQVYFGAEMSPGSLVKAEEAKLSREDDDAFARAFALDCSTPALYAVFESTAAEIAASAWLRRGFYRGELLMLYSIAESTGTTFSVLAKEREKGASLRELAAKYGADLMRLFREAQARQKTLEEKAARDEEAFNASRSTAPAAAAPPPAENEKK